MVGKIRRGVLNRHEEKTGFGRIDEMGMGTNAYCTGNTWGGSVFWHLHLPLREKRLVSCTHAFPSPPFRYHTFAACMTITPPFPPFPPKIYSRLESR